MKVQWLDPDRTHAVVTVGWFRKRTAEVHLYPRNGWYYGPPNVKTPVFSNTWSDTFEAENRFYEKATPLNKGLSDDMNWVRKESANEDRKAKEEAHWTQVQDLPEAKLLPTRIGSLTPK